LAFIAAAALLAWSMWKAWRVDEIAAPAALSTTTAPNGEAIVAERYDLRRVLAAVDKDLFHPARRRPGRRFGVQASGAVAAASTEPSPAVRVIGTAVSQDGAGGFAMCALGAGTPRIVRVGERLGDWTLSKVTPGAAEFATANGTTVVVRIAKVGT
jgi:hypothetical protein